MPSSTEIYAELTEIFREIFAQDDLVLSPTLSADDVSGWDSYKQIEIIVATEEHFKIKLHTRDLDNLRNVGDLVQAIMARLAAKQ